MSARARVVIVLLLAGCSPQPQRAAKTTRAEAEASASTRVAVRPPRSGPHLDAASRRELLLAIHRAADYLARACTDSGRFVYRVHLDPEIELDDDYNVLRHAGAIYAMTSYQMRWPNERMRSAIARATDFLRHEHIAPVADHQRMSAVWSESGGDREAKLGGAGLALVALSNVGARARSLDALAAFVLWMQKDDGSFYSKYLPEGVGRDDSWTSLYYPGEAALGLLMAYRHTRQPLQLAAATHALGFLAESRQGKSQVPPDHWALLATRALLTGDPVSAEKREQLLRHGLQVAGAMLDERATHPLDSARHGCFGADGRTTPTATRLEGLLALYEVLDADQHADVRRRIAEAARDGIAFLRRAQVADGAHAGGIPGALPAVGDAAEVRIDYVQHALSAFIQYLELDAPE